MRPDFQTVVNDLQLMERLVDFSPTIIGTPPLGIATNQSDIDIACYASLLDHFERKVTMEFQQKQNYYCDHITTRNKPAMCAGFYSNCWDIEIFCQATPVENQWGVRHFQIEKRLLQLDRQLIEPVLKLKKSGMKTEPAFARILGLSGDPYEAMLLLENYSDHYLMRLIQSR